MREGSRRTGLSFGVSAPAAACALLGLRLIRPWAWKPAARGKHRSGEALHATQPIERL